MITSPFSGYLDCLPNSFCEETISRKGFIAISFPVPASFLSHLVKMYPEIKAPKKNGLTHYNIRELICSLRVHSAPMAGFYSFAPVRHAEILELVPDAKNPELIRTVKIAAAFTQFEHEQAGRGQLVFACPFCGEPHFHGGGDLHFGSGNGHRHPHCTCRNRSYLRRDTQHISQRLSKYWDFYLVEVKDVNRAGGFSKNGYTVLSTRPKLRGTKR